jgi:curved DNA-binding protein CbpA
MDPYRVLGLESGASQAEVKRAYRRLAKALHPDAAGEAALPRFLEIQEAYERLTGTKVRTVRAPRSSSPSGPPTDASRRTGGATSASSEGFHEPWRADPDRARAAREQARARRAWPGGQPSWTSDRRGASTPRGPAAGAAGRQGGDSRRDPSTGSADGAGRGPGSGERGDQARPGGRRRASRKATLGSTSYDEAREPADRSWAGASWYGPTTGEYWHINPREYADPRKHGPGYSSRGRTEHGPGSDTEIAGHGSPEGPGSEDHPGAEGAPVGEAPPHTGARGFGGTSTAARSATAFTRQVDPSAARGGAGRAEADRASAPSVPPGRVDHVSGSFPAARSDAWRRLGLVLLAWPPLGLAAATAIGQATGCLSYSVSCDTADSLLPWVAQAVLLAVLFGSPWLARVLGGGTIGALIALVPGVGILTALGGASSSEGGPVLAGWLALAWLAGAAVAARRALALTPPAR